MKPTKLMREALLEAKKGPLRRPMVPGPGKPPWPVNSSTLAACVRHGLLSVDVIRHRKGYDVVTSSEGTIGVAQSGPAVRKHPGPGHREEPPMPDVPYGFCHCGCGQRTKIAAQTSARDGYVKGEPRIFLPGHWARTSGVGLEDPAYAERFWAKVEKTTSCWLWRGSKNPAGYGIVRLGQRQPVAHRIAYQLAVGPIPDGLTLDHLCENKGCVNPAHLEPVTGGVNNLRGNSPWALNAKRLTCKHGHPLEGENLRITPRGTRACRACARRATREHRQRLKDAA